MTDEETVWTAPTGRTGNTRTYHTDGECQYITEHHSPRARSNVPDDFTECKVCAGETDRKNIDQTRPFYLELKDAASGGEGTADD